MGSLFGYLACRPYIEALVYASELIFMSGLVRTHNPMSAPVYISQQSISSFKLIHYLILIKFYNMSIEVPSEHSNFFFQRILWQNSSLENLCAFIYNRSRTLVNF